MKIFQVPGCGDYVLESNKDFSVDGGCMNGKWKCNSGHSGMWSSSETVGSGRSKMAAINLQIIVFTLLTGISWDKLEVFFLYIIMICIKVFF